MPTVRRSGTGGPASPHESQHVNETQHGHETQQIESQVAETEAARRANQAQQVQQTADPSRENSIASPEEAGRRRLESRIEGTARQVQLRSNYLPGRTIDGIRRMDEPPQTAQTVNIAQEPAFQALPEATRNRMMNEIRQNPNTSDQLQQVVNHPQYDDLSTRQQTQLLNVFANSDQNGREALPTLMSRQVQTGNPPQTGPALLSPDNTANRTTLLDNLDRLSTQPLRPDLESRRGELLGNVIQETAEPSWHISQARSGTCIEASVQHHLIRNSPSEYARIIGGLSSPEQAVTLADGSRMEAAQNDTAVPQLMTRIQDGEIREDVRSVTSRMFQSAARQHGHQAPLTEDGLGPGYSENANSEGPPLHRQGTLRVMNGIYNGPYEVQGLEQNREYTPEEAAPIQQGTHRRIQQELNNGNGPVLTGIQFGEEGHMVAVERIENGRVYFRNPWGSTDIQHRAGPYYDGQERTHPPRRVEDAQSGLESMSEREFQEVLLGTVVEPEA